VGASSPCWSLVHLLPLPPPSPKETLGRAKRKPFAGPAEEIPAAYREAKAALHAPMPTGLFATGNRRFNTGTQPASICVVESRPLASCSRRMRIKASFYPVFVGQAVGSVGAGPEGGEGGEQAMGGGSCDTSVCQ
jgi:hypothetical protein